MRKLILILSLFIFLALLSSCSEESNTSSSTENENNIIGSEFVAIESPSPGTTISDLVLLKGVIQRPDLLEDGYPKYKLGNAPLLTIPNYNPVNNSFEFYLDTSLAHSDGEVTLQIVLNSNGDKAEARYTVSNGSSFSKAFSQDFGSDAFTNAKVIRVENNAYVVSADKLYGVNEVLPDILKVDLLTGSVTNLGRLPKLFNQVYPTKGCPAIYAGKIFYAGGKAIIENNPTSSATIYFRDLDDPDALWQTMGVSLNHDRYNAACYQKDNKLYLIGGQYIAAGNTPDYVSATNVGMEVVDLQYNTVQSMSILNRSARGSVIYYNNSLHLIAFEDDAGNARNEIRSYNLQTGTWSTDQIPAIPDGEERIDAAVGIVDTVIYIVGGGKGGTLNSDILYINLADANPQWQVASNIAGFGTPAETTWQFHVYFLGGTKLTDPSGTSEEPITQPIKLLLGYAIDLQ